MNISKAMMAVEVTILVIVLAVVVPRVIARARTTVLSQDQIDHGSEALDYARQRMWGDFLDSRAKPFPGHELPGPSLEEYMFFLNANGLYRKGDRVVIPVLPPIDPEKPLDRLRIELQHTTLPVRLGISLQSLENDYDLVGQIEVFVETDGTWGLTVNRTEPTPSLLSYWPVTPNPILP